MTLAPITVTSSTLWPEYEIISEDESAFDTDMSDDNGYANSLVPESRIDEYVKSLLESFEILPQLLYYFGVKNEVDSLDWATIVVYTCEASCDGSSAYKEEFVWVQLDSQSTTARR